MEHRPRARDGKINMRKAQSTIEYAVLIAIVAAAFLAMHLYVQRAVQANFKLIEDQVNAEPE
jgi:Flp pilus assembly pilin Flp